MQTGKLLFSVILCVLVGSASGLLIGDAINTWYAGLNKPAFNPPNWIFAPVWTVLYITMGVAFYFYQIAKTDRNKTKGYFFFFVQLVLNFFWSILFFNLHAPGFAFAEILLLIIAIAATVYFFYPVSKNAALLLLPYLLWVCFAAWLNYSIMVLN
ncbi:MAG: TspO/MBR family protein [Chitinophagales bacterium]